ncbi:hypothetical protein ACNKHN_09295 [Shigella flexneri]
MMTREMVDSMKAGSVIVDLPPKTAVTANIPCLVTTSVRKRGQSDWLYPPAGRLPTQSSQLYGTNLVNLLKLLSKEKTAISPSILTTW